MVSWYPINKTATLLMAPYLSWLCLATCLNYCIWRDNPEKKEEQGARVCAEMSRFQIHSFLFHKFQNSFMIKLRIHIINLSRLYFDCSNLLPELFFFHLGPMMGSLGGFWRVVEESTPPLLWTMSLHKRFLWLKYSFCYC